MTPRLEHANLAVQDLAEALRFVQTAFPEFPIRYQSPPEDPDPWVHVGTEDSYLALSTATKDRASTDQPYTGYPGVQHLGFEVPDAEGLRQRLLAAGFTESTVPNNHPHRKRVYFLDADGNDWEFVEYLNDDPTLRHDYTL